MIISEIKDKEVWENFLSGCEEKTFLQSWNWGEFQKELGNKIWRLGIYDNKSLLGTALASKIRAKRGTYLLIQHGPNIQNQNEKSEARISEVFLGELKKIGKKENCSFVRMNPLISGNKENQARFKKIGLRESPMHANAYEATWKFDILPKEEILLANMRKTTRYLIRQTMKNKDLSIEASENTEDVKIYQELNEQVSERQKFTPFSKEYIKKEFEIFSKEKEALWLFGRYKGEIAAGALIIFWQKIAFYHQAASLGKFAKFSIPYLLLWEAIKEAKKRDCILYDFWGYVDPKKNPKHPWAGPTLFKMGFGGKPYQYMKTQDFPLSLKYWPVFIFEKIRKAKRNL